MFKQALTIVMLLAFWGLSAFTHTENDEKWTATLKLEGIQKPYVLTSDAIYGGYNSYDKKFFFFGKNHMFADKGNAEITKIFNDLCITNAAGKFEFELNGVNSNTPSNKASSYSGNISFKRKKPIQGTFGIGKAKQKEITFSGDFKTLGFQLTEEAQKVMTGKFTLNISSNK